MIFSENPWGKKNKQTKTFLNEKFIPEEFALYLHTIPPITAQIATERYYYYTNFRYTINTPQNPMALFI